MNDAVLFWCEEVGVRGSVSGETSQRFRADEQPWLYRSRRPERVLTSTTPFAANG